MLKLFSYEKIIECSLMKQNSIFISMRKKLLKLNFPFDREKTYFVNIWEKMSIEKKWMYTRKERLVNLL